MPRIKTILWVKVFICMTEPIFSQFILARKLLSNAIILSFSLIVCFGAVFAKKLLLVPNKKVLNKKLYSAHFPAEKIPICMYFKPPSIFGNDGDHCDRL
jgi:hypothetical protein